MTQKLLSVKAVAKFLEVSRSTLYELIKNDGLAPSLYVGCSPRWTDDDLQTWVDSRKLSAGKK